MLCDERVELLPQGGEACDALFGVLELRGSLSARVVAGMRRGARPTSLFSAASRTVAASVMRAAASQHELLGGRQNREVAREGGSRLLASFLSLSASRLACCSSWILQASLASCASSRLTSFACSSVSCALRASICTYRRGKLVSLVVERAELHHNHVCRRPLEHSSCPAWRRGTLLAVSVCLWMPMCSLRACARRCRGPAGRRKRLSR